MEFSWIEIFVIVVICGIAITVIIVNALKLLYLRRRLDFFKSAILGNICKYEVLIDKRKSPEGMFFLTPEQAERLVERYKNYYQRAIQLTREDSLEFEIGLLIEDAGRKLIPIKQQIDFCKWLIKNTFKALAVFSIGIFILKFFVYAAQ
jgi:hypothetical protein